MRTHELARYLVQLARMLRRSPDLDLKDTRPSNLFLATPNRSVKGQSLRKDDIPVALSALLALSSIDKRVWAELIFDLNLPIQIRPRDASRDLLGKVLTLLEKDPVARTMLTHSVKLKSTRASPELVRALSTLLK